MPSRHPPSTVAAALDLRASGLPATEVGRRLGVDAQTVRRWSRGGARAGIRAASCEACGGSHDFSALEGASYAYLLAAYLGDGHIAHQRRTNLLRVSLDVAYPEIVASVQEAIEQVRGRAPFVRPDHEGKACVHVCSAWVQWPCHLPQHGPGRKHDRRIELVGWQRDIVAAHPEALLRGLIHTDGWRGLNRVRVKGRDYAYPRYQFSNRSDDIRQLFTDTCDALGIAWRPWGRWHVSVARRDAVAAMDAFIGPKR